VCEALNAAGEVRFATDPSPNVQYTYVALFATRFMFVTLNWTANGAKPEVGDPVNPEEMVEYSGG
jgi:hypothetical protein